MPNRILRDWTDSKAVNNLKWEEEVFFTRIIMKADDFGKYYADSVLLKSLLFPRKDGLRCSDIDRWLKSLEAAGLIRTYQSSTGDSFLQIRKFNQRLRSMKSNFPEPPEEENMPVLVGDGRLTVISPPEGEGNEGREGETNSKRIRNEGEGEGENSRSRIFKNLFEYLKKNGYRFYPSQCQTAKNQVIKFQHDHGITDESILNADPALRKKFDAFDETVFNRNLAAPMKKDIEEMWDYYEARNFKIDGQPIQNWRAVMKGWMNKKSRFEKKTA